MGKDLIWCLANIDSIEKGTMQPHLKQSALFPITHGNFLLPIASRQITAFGKRQFEVIVFEFFESINSRIGLEFNKKLPYCLFSLINLNTTASRSCQFSHKSS
jgi:hypothetical protein